MGKNDKTISWDAFQSLGNPENAPKASLDTIDQESIFDFAQSVVRVFLDKKNRKGKGVTLIKGILCNDEEDLIDLGKKLKKQCGVGGSTKNGEILLQGDHRAKVIEILHKEGFKNVKKSGG